MIIQYPTGVLRPYYDRNAVDVSKYFLLYGLNPHVMTQRWIYTVPANRRAHFGGVYAKIVRVTVATTIFRWGLWYMKNAATSLVTIAELSSISNSIGATYVLYYPLDMWLVAGETLEMKSEDDSTAGTVDYFGSAVITEFDA